MAVTRASSSSHVEILGLQRVRRSQPWLVLANALPVTAVAKSKVFPVIFINFVLVSGCSLIFMAYYSTHIVQVNITFSLIVYLFSSDWKLFLIFGLVKGKFS